MTAETTPSAEQETFGIKDLKLESTTTNTSTTNDLTTNYDLEQFYDLIRRSDNTNDEPAHQLLSRLIPNTDINVLLKNGDTVLCLACNKGYQDLVVQLVEIHEASVNLCRSINTTFNSSSYSSFTPTITISSRRQSRLVSGAGGVSSLNKSKPNIVGDSPLAVCIKYGFDSIAEYLIDKQAHINGKIDQDDTTNDKYAEFERSPLQEAIRLNRTKIVEKMFQSMFERNDIPTIEWVFAKRYDILRQVLMTENLEMIKVILPNIIEDRRIDGEMLIHILNYLLMKSKIQERKDKVNQILETVMEIGTTCEQEVTGDLKIQPFEIFNLEIFVRGFLATLKALFNAVSSDDSRTSILNYRTSLFFFYNEIPKVSAQL